MERIFMGLMVGGSLLFTVTTAVAGDGPDADVQGDPLPQYEVFPLPVEHPEDGPRSVQQMPAEPQASPFGWHDTDGVLGAEFAITRGNNVHAFGDRDGDNLPDPGGEPSSPDLDFTGALVPLDLSMDPSTYLAASVTNMFYWNNICHDLLYLYGFDEAAGNFQEFNYGSGTPGGDAVEAQAQKGADIGFTNVGAFSTPPDGASPRMQMGVWAFTDPPRDSGLSNVVVIHEYVHGLTARLTGGPSNVACLSHEETMTEGWSDWYALAFTAEATDTATMPRSLGNYLLGLPAGDPGFRPVPYSTDLAVNDFTYADIANASSFHTVGFIWGTMLWDAYWLLVERHGFNPDLYDTWDTGGNNLALQLVTDGLKLQPCVPGFEDSRDAVLMADQLLTGGQNQCLLWQAFARRGLGFSADQGSPNSTADGVEAFDLPVACLDALFSDGFESGSTASWSSSVG